MRKALTACGVLLALLSGCSRSQEDRQAALPDPDSAGGQFAGLSPLPVDERSGPDVVVAAFLDALRDGNDRVAEALLTDFARQAVTEHGMTVRPPGSPSSTYQIGNVFRVQGGAHVESIWTEHTPASEAVVYEIRWMLRKQVNGWRVVGMSTAANPNGPPIFLNFEDVPDLLDKWQQVDEELAAQDEQPEALQAARPSDSLRR